MGYDIKVQAHINYTEFISPPFSMRIFNLSFSFRLYYNPIYPHQHALSIFLMGIVNLTPNVVQHQLFSMTTLYLKTLIKRNNRIEIEFYLC